jgi:hypothetical protein
LLSHPDSDTCWSGGFVSEPTVLLIDLIVEPLIAVADIHADVIKDTFP